MKGLDVDDAWRFRWEFDSWYHHKPERRICDIGNIEVKAEIQLPPWGSFRPRLEQYPGAADALIHAELVDSCARHISRTVTHSLIAPRRTRGWRPRWRT